MGRLGTGCRREAGPLPHRFIVGPNPGSGVNQSRARAAHRQQAQFRIYELLKLGST